MLCPTCDNVNLAMTDRQGIEIDYCPKCRGIWLDRGELDRLIERAEQASDAPAQAAPIQAAPIHATARHYDSDHSRHASARDQYPRQHHDQHHDGYRKKRPKSLLGELFDF